MTLELSLQAALTAKGCIAAFNETPEADLAATMAGCLSDKQKAANKRNEDCLYILIHCFAKNMRMQAKISKTRYGDWPNGRAWDVVKFINQEFKSSNESAEEKKMQSLAEITMGFTDNPQDLFDKIDIVDVTYLSTKLKMDDKEKLLHCKSKLPKQLYGDTIRQSKSDWKQKPGNTDTTPMDYDFFVRCMNEKYEEINTAEEGEVSFLNLIASKLRTKNNGGGNGNGNGGNDNGDNGNNEQICPNCGEAGHTQKQCPRKDE